MRIEKRRVSPACPLDCWDSCAILATVEEGRLTLIEGNPSNPVTGKILCAKGYQHIHRMRHKDRLRKPMVRRNGIFEETTWENALALITEKLAALKKEYPTTALLQCTHAGSVGLLKKLESRFFSAYGGVTTSTGSLCEGAGHQAQIYDFGNTLSHEISDVANAKVILIWGRNPQETGIHAMPFLR